MPLTEEQKKKLRGLGHKMKPVVTIGSAGLSESVLEEFLRSLDHHELMKVKVSVGDRDKRAEILTDLCMHAKAELVQRVGNIGLLFRKRKKKSRFAAL
jgi:RNA-binding protein